VTVRRISQCLTILVMLLGGGVREAHGLWHACKGLHTCCVHASPGHGEHGGLCCLDASTHAGDAAPETLWQFAWGWTLGAEEWAAPVAVSTRKAKGFQHGREAHPCPAQGRLRPAPPTALPSITRAWPQGLACPDRLARLSLYRI